METIQTFGNFKWVFRFVFIQANLKYTFLKIEKNILTNTFYFNFSGVKS